MHVCARVDAAARPGLERAGVYLLMFPIKASVADVFADVFAICSS